ncbi:hypothetical protein CJU90_2017 [Yarrowia sp. C11]|nr:hypothetical protein CKK34_6045 [Yarrowia sp. E02]KAG5371949.1 hypothetical protein CJU90_2017 [Yarrowia sp. C11]
MDETIHTLITSLGSIKDPATRTATDAYEIRTSHFGNLVTLTPEARNAFVALTYLLPHFDDALGLLDSAEFKKLSEGRWEVKMPKEEFRLVDIHAMFCSCHDYAVACYGDDVQKQITYFPRNQPFDEYAGVQGICKHLVAVYVRRWSGLFPS